MSPVDPRRLETFRVVAIRGQVSAAAKQLHLSQPAVTAQIRALEEEVGGPLFSRGTKGMTLNPAGRVLLECAERVRKLLDAAADAVGQPSEMGPLVVAASSTIAGYVLPSVIAGFLASAPGVGVRLEVGNTAAVFEAVLAGRAPFGLVEGYARRAGVRLERYLDDELIPVEAADVPANHTLGALDHRRLIWREPGSGTRAVVERALRTAGVGRRPREDDLEFGSTEAIRRAALAGLGTAFLSRWTVGADLSAGRLRPVALRGVTVRRAFSWVLPGGTLSGVAARFVRYARAHPPIPSP